MKAIVCEMCSSNNVVKKDGQYECQNCGTKYSVEEAQKLMIEGTVDVSGSSVKIDSSEDVSNLYTVARRAVSQKNYELARKHYEMIVIKDPNSWEAAFYTVYCQASCCKIAEIGFAARSVGNCLDTVLRLVADQVNNREDQISVVNEIFEKCKEISVMLFNSAKNYFDEGVSRYNEIRSNSVVLYTGAPAEYVQTLLDGCLPTRDIMYILGNTVDSLFGDYQGMNAISVSAWKDGIDMHFKLYKYLPDKEANKDEIISYQTKIRKYEPTYSAPELEEPNQKWARNQTDYKAILIVVGVCIVVFVIFFCWMRSIS